jgi:hypothetical protein
VLLRLFDVMMIILKSAVLAKIENQGADLVMFEEALNKYDARLHVLKPDDASGRNNPGRRAIEQVHHLVRDQKKWWLLAPMWALNENRRGDVRQFLDVKGG